MSALTKQIFTREYLYIFPTNPLVHWLVTICSFITYISVSIPNQWTVPGYHWQLASKFITGHVGSIRFLYFVLISERMSLGNDWIVHIPSSWIMEAQLVGQEAIWAPILNGKWWVKGTSGGPRHCIYCPLMLQSPQHLKLGPSRRGGLF